MNLNFSFISNLLAPNKTGQFDPNYPATSHAKRGRVREDNKMGIGLSDGIYRSSQLMGLSFHKWVLGDKAKCTSCCILNRLLW